MFCFYYVTTKLIHAQTSPFARSIASISKEGSTETSEQCNAMFEQQQKGRKSEMFPMFRMTFVVRIDDDCEDSTAEAEKGERRSESRKGNETKQFLFTHQTEAELSGLIYELRRERSQTLIDVINKAVPVAGVTISH